MFVSCESTSDVFEDIAYDIIDSLKEEEIIPKGARKIDVMKCIKENEIGSTSAKYYIYEDEEKNIYAVECFKEKSKECNVKIYYNVLLNTEEVDYHKSSSQDYEYENNNDGYFKRSSEPFYILEKAEYKKHYIATKKHGKEYEFEEKKKN